MSARLICILFVCTATFHRYTRSDTIAKPDEAFEVTWNDHGSINISGAQFGDEVPEELCSTPVTLLK